MTRTATAVESLLFTEILYVSWRLNMFSPIVIMQRNYSMFLSYTYKPMSPQFKESYTWLRVLYHIKKSI